MNYSNAKSKGSTKTRRRGPISLMNINMKILTKTLANRIQQRIELHTVVQSGLLQGWFSIQKSISVIQHFNKTKTENDMVLSVNAKKSGRNQHLFMTFKKLPGKLL